MHFSFHKNEIVTVRGMGLGIEWQPSLSILPKAASMKHRLLPLAALLASLALSAHAQTAASPLAQRVLAELPQTQCTRCGYPDCAAYAQAIADEQAPINRCPPGGAEGVERLAADRPGRATP